jgi:hypothetical protein
MNKMSWIAGSQFPLVDDFPLFCHIQLVLWLISPLSSIARDIFNHMNHEVFLHLRLLLSCRMCRTCQLMSLVHLCVVLCLGLHLLPFVPVPIEEMWTYLGESMKKTVLNFKVEYCLFFRQCYGVCCEILRNLPCFCSLLHRAHVCTLRCLSFESKCAQY